MNEARDGDLVLRAREGDREAWERLVQRHAPRLSAYLGARLRRVEVVDNLVAEAVFAAWRHLANLKDPDDFPAWFRGIGANLALRWHTKNKSKTLKGRFPAERCGGDVAMISEMQQLEDALGRLDEQHRMALEQRFRAGLDGEELAEALHLDEASAASAVEDALVRLDALLEESQPADPVE